MDTDITTAMATIPEKLERYENNYGYEDYRDKYYKQYYKENDSCWYYDSYYHGEDYIYYAYYNSYG